MSKHTERPVHQIVDKVFDSLDRLDKQLESIHKIISELQHTNSDPREVDTDTDENR